MERPVNVSKSKRPETQMRSFRFHSAIGRLLGQVVISPVLSGSLIQSGISGPVRNQKDTVPAPDYIVQARRHEAV